MSSASRRRRIGIVVPVFNDWPSFAQLLREIANQQELRTYDLSVIAVDDCSFNQPDPASLDYPGSIKLRVVRLASNLGAMRAIAVGLVVAAENGEFDAVIVMDSDGEDRPEDIGRLLVAWEEQPNRIVVARRAERSEGFVFKSFYLFYKLIFRLLVGQTINFGSFSLLPSRAVQALVHTPAIWNNLPAAVIRSRFPYLQLETKRGQRFAGKSSMNFVSLCVHGVSAISVFTDLVLLRLMIAMIGIATLTMLAMLVVVAIKLGTNWAIPGWASYVGGSLVIIFVQSLLFAAVALIQFLYFRTLKAFLPITDAYQFIAASEPGSKAPALAPRQEM